LSFFVIDSLNKSGYTPAAPQGGNGKKLFENKANSSWQIGNLAKVEVATLCRYVGLGLGGPWVTQGSPKGHARVTQASIGKKSFVCNKSWKKGRGGGAWLRDAGRRPQKSPESEKQNL
jgi:hypothetical protein